MFFMNFWIQLLLATNESWIAGSTFPKSNMAFPFARIIFRETWSMRDLRSWIRFRSFSSIYIITCFRPHPSSLSFIGALAIILSMLLIHSLFLSAPNLEAAKFMKCSWANLTTSLFETLHTTLLSYLWGTKVLKSFPRPFLTNFNFSIFMYRQDDFWRCQRQEMCHKHSYNETSGICRLFKRASNDKTNIIFLFLLSLLFLRQDVKTWQEYVKNFGFF